MGNAENELKKLAEGLAWEIPELTTLQTALAQVRREVRDLSVMEGLQGNAADAAKKEFSELGEVISQAQETIGTIEASIRSANRSRDSAIERFDNLPSAEMNQSLKDGIKGGGMVFFGPLGWLAAEGATNAINGHLADEREKAAKEALDHLNTGLSEDKTTLQTAVSQLPMWRVSPHSVVPTPELPDDHFGDIGGGGGRGRGGGPGGIGGGGGEVGQIPDLGGGDGSVPTPDLPRVPDPSPLPIPGDRWPQPYPMPDPTPDPRPDPTPDPQPDPRDRFPEPQPITPDPTNPGNNPGGNDGGWGGGGWRTPGSGGLYDGSGVSVDGSTGGSLPGSVGFGGAGGSGGGLSDGLLAGGGVAGGLAGGALGSRLARSGAGGLGGTDGAGGTFGGAGGAGAGGAAGAGAGAAGSRNGMMGGMGMGGMGGGAGSEKKRSGQNYLVPDFEEDTPITHSDAAGAGRRE